MFLMSDKVTKLSQKSWGSTKWFYAPLVRYHYNFFKNLAGPPVYYSGSNEPSLSPQFKIWLHNTFKKYKYLRNKFICESLPICKFFEDPSHPKSLTLF